MNKKFSTLVASMLLATTVGTVSAQNLEFTKSALPTNVRVESVADGVVGAGLVGCRCAALGVEDGGFAVGDCFNKFLWFVDAVIHTGKNHRLTVKTGGLDVFVRCNDDAVTGGNFLDGQHVFRAV